MRGYLIALIGSDGAGKSAVASRLKEKFEAEKCRVSVVYMGCSNPVLFTSKLLLKLGELKEKRIKRKNLFSRENKPNRCSFIHEMTFIHYIAELFVRYFIRIYPRVKRGEIVIADRYIYDFLILRRLLNTYAWFNKFMMCIIPKPDILFCLHNDPGTTLKRKTDNSRDEIIRQTNIFFSLEEQVSTFRKFKTEGSLDDTTYKMFEEIKGITGNDK